MRLAGSLRKWLAEWISALGHSSPPPVVSGSYALAGYLAVSRRPGWPRTLDDRTALLASQLAVELSGCRWCIDRGRHEWRTAGLSDELLRQLPLYSCSPLFTARERAALSFVSAVAVVATDACHLEEDVLQGARHFFSELELAQLTALVAGLHDRSSPVGRA